MTSDYQQQNSAMQMHHYSHQQNANSVSQQPYHHNQQQAFSGTAASFPQQTMHHMQPTESKGMTLAELQEKISGCQQGRVEDQQQLRTGVSQASG